MTQLSPHFTRKEFRCKCGCKKDTVDVQLMQALNLLRLHFKAPVTIISGFRCPGHNNFVGGAKNSLHTEGKAADIKVKDILPIIVYNYLEEMHPGKYGLGLYKRNGGGWCHLDVREKKARWSK